MLFISLKGKGGCWGSEAGGGGGGVLVNGQVELFSGFSNLLFLMKKLQLPYQNSFDHRILRAIVTSKFTVCMYFKY